MNRLLTVDVHPAQKKQMVRGMFDDISGRYDFLNRFLSLGIDTRWRRKAIRMLIKTNPSLILDVATGTADMAILEAAILNPVKITGIDISEKMLAVGIEKVRTRGLDQLIELKQADSENIPFESNNFDAVTVAFGVRNFEDMAKGISEMARVLKKGGTAIILEFSLPEKGFARWAYTWYFNKVLPLLGRLISGSSFAYSYLPQSVSDFPRGKDFIEIMLRNGFSGAEYKLLSLGICTIYSGIK